MDAEDTGNTFEAFGRDMLAWARSRENFFGDEDSEKFMEIAEKHGLVQRVKYDPALHGEIEDAEPGCDVWWFGNSASDGGQ